MNQKNWKGILVYLEMRNGGLCSVSKELIGEAARLAAKKPMPIYAVGITNDEKIDKEELSQYPIDEIHLYKSKYHFQADVYEEAVEDCVRSLKPEIVLIGGTSYGRALAPRIAVTFRTGLTADCTELDLDEQGNLIQIRPAFGGNIMASIQTETRPQMATVRPGIMVPYRGEVVAQPQLFVNELKTTRKLAKTLKMQKVKTKSGIGEQEILVAAGRGVERKEDLKMLRELAELLGGTLASSRALVEKGWTKPEEQIGLSGTAVRPKCIITVGISGSVQFQAGMKQTPNIIAINTDSNAKIFEIAHYPICADLYEVVPAWIEKLKEEKWN